MTAVGLPAGWRFARVGDLALFEHGFAFKGDLFLPNGSKAVVTPGNFIDSGGFRDVGERQRYYAAPFPKRYELRPGDLIVAMTEQAAGLLGSSAFVPVGRTWLHNQRIGRVVLKSGLVSTEYLFHLFNSTHFREAVNRTAAGTKVRHTSPGKLGEIEIPLPPVEEQLMISAALDAADNLIAALVQTVAKKQAIKQGMMQQLLAGRTRLPGFSGEWTTRRIGDFTEVRAGGTPSTAVSRYWEGDVRWMSSGEIHSKRVSEVQGRITADGLRESAAQLLPPGTVLMALAGQGKTRGTVAISLVALSTNQSIAGILPGSEHDPTFLYYTLDTRYEELRGESSGDGGRGGLNLTIIKNLKVFMPGRDEQAAIATVLTDVDDEIDALNLRLTKARAVKQGMRQELLTGRSRLPVEGAA